MAKYLSDTEVEKLIGTVLIDADSGLLNPNGIRLRLGRHVLFQSTGEEKELEPGMYLKVHPGESVLFTSLETIDFSEVTVHRVMPGCMLMGLITPTTTMVREANLQSTTKVDAGFHGVLNWGLRNSSANDLVIEYGEPIFKLTIIALHADEEIPQSPYGGRNNDVYQASTGIVRSARKIPAVIPKAKTVSSNFDQLDPKKQLREAGYPFDHIGRELVELHGKWEVVSTDVRLMKEQFEKQTAELREKISVESATLSKKIEESGDTTLLKMENSLQKAVYSIGGVIVGGLVLLYSGISYLQGKLTTESLSFIAILVAVAILVATFIVVRLRR